MKTIIGTVAGFALGIGVASVLAQANAPYYEVAEISVKDQAGYENSGVAKAREAIKANGGKVIAGGYNKAEGIIGAPPANRVLITMYPSKAASEKAWADAMAWTKEGGKYADLRAIRVEGVQ
jgi:uncharacterized protein (DUF1330 family)